MEKDLFELVLENGETKQFIKIAEFRSLITHKDYIMFTDKETTNNIYFNILKKDNDKVIFEKIETDIDKSECQKALDELKERATKKE